MTFDELWWPDLWPELKICRIVSVNIFYAFSVAACYLSLRGPGPELERGREKPPPQHDKENTGHQHDTENTGHQHDTENTGHQHGAG